MSKVKVGIIGATGYVGVELIRLLNSHPQVELTAIGSNSFVDKSITEVYPSVGITNDMKCIKCGKYPFCNKIQDSQQEACENFRKRKLIITTNSPLIMNKEARDTEIKL